jgi:hypothetical protein
VLGPLFDPYLNKGPWITVIALLLSVFALKDYSQPILIALLAIGFMLGSLFIPVANVIPGFSNLTLLDRPFVEMILYLPLAVLGGLGFAGLESYLRNQKIKVGAVLLLAAIVIGHTLISYDLYPADCCVMAGNDDVTALDWMDKHLPSNALIGIATTTLNVLPTDSFEGYVGSDAGIWITPLIDRSTRVVQYDSDFDQPATLNVLCEANVNYLYVGELGQTFDTAKLNNHPDWYKMLLAMPKASVYEVVGCR